MVALILLFVSNSLLGMAIFGSVKIVRNDEARSIRLRDVPAGWTIRVYDSPSQDKNDDWMSIVTTECINDFLIDKFEQPKTSGGFIQTSHRHNGLDGKISNLEIVPPS